MNIRKLIEELIKWPQDLDETLAVVEIWQRDENGAVSNRKVVPVARVTIDGSIIIEQSEIVEEK